MRGKIAVFLLLGLTFTFSQAQSQVEQQLQQRLKLASTKVKETQAVLPEISMDFQDANLKDVLKVFSQQAGLNFIASGNIKDRRVTLYLDKVSVQDALDNIMNANNLTYNQKKDSSIFIVKEWGRPEIETITMIFPLQYARVKGYELTSAAEIEETTKEIGIKDVVEKLLTQYGRITEDSRTNSLIVTDVSTQLPKIERAIKKLDVKLPQVMIEAEIIEASLETVDKLGIEWGDATSGDLLSASGASRTDSFPFTKITSPDVITFTTGTISAANLSGTLAMLAKDTDTKILARPRILTLNNQTAIIKITAQTAVNSAQVQTAAEGLATQTTTIERFETGVSLEVTPQINKAGEITMSLEPSVTTVKASTLLSNVSDPQERSVQTIVTVNDGETVIIGGLIDTNDTRISKKVPFFGNIPLLGNLFRKQDDTSTDKEVIIFITPHLVKDGARTPGLALEKQAPWEYERLGLKEEAMERFLDRFEE